MVLATMPPISLGLSLVTFDRASRLPVLAVPHEWPRRRRLQQESARRGFTCARDAVSNLQLARDEIPDHLARLVGLRARRGDPFVHRALEQPVLALAARGAVGPGEFLLELRQH